MAREQKRIRTVAVRLRSVAFARLRGSAARRLFVVAGIVAGFAVAGWLLGSAGPAHADTLPTPTADTPQAVLRAVSGGTGAVATVPVGGRTASRSSKTSGAMATPLEQSAHHAAGAVADVAAAAASVPGASSPHQVSGGLARSLRAAGRALPSRPSTVLGSPGTIWRAVTDFASNGSWPQGTGPGFSWTPWHRHRAVAGIGDRAGAHAPGPLAASGASKGGRMAFGTAFSHPAPLPGTGLPHPLCAQAETLLLAARPTMTGGGGLTHLAGGLWARRSLILAAAPCVAAPALHPTTDEPSFSPD